MEHVFITSKSWANLGGLPGMCLSARACGAPDVTIHGPPGCMQLYEATKGFILLFEFEVLEHRLEDGEFSDGAVSVRSVPLPRSEHSTAPEVKAEWEGLLEVERQEGAIRFFLKSYCLDHILQIPLPSGTKTRPLLTSVHSPQNPAGWTLMLV